MKKIILFTRSYLPQIGGREIVVYYLARAYRQLGYDARVVGRLGFSKRKLRPADVPVHAWPSLFTVFQAIGFLRPLFDILQRIELRVVLLLEMLIWGADVVHVHTTYPQGYIAAKLINWFPNVLLVVTPHGNDIHTIPSISHGMGLDPNVAKRIQFALQKAHLITSIADGITASVVKYGISESRIVSIRNGVDTERFIEVAEVSRAPQPGEILNIVSIGNYHLRKGHKVLVDAVAELAAQGRKCHLTIVGGTNDELVKYTRSKDVDCYFAGKIMFTPGGDHPADPLVDILRSSHIYVSASINAEAEGMSLAVLEAMASGLPVVATDISGNRDIIDSYANGALVTPNDADSLAEGILKVAGDLDEYARMCENSIQGAKSLSWLSVARTYASTFDEYAKAKFT